MKKIKTKQMEDFSSLLVAWQKRSGRHHLPWQNTQNPYRVWVSEIMLQQTQVITVQQYYKRFLKHYPNVRSLAAAPVDDILSLWSGLGYYARARNMHKCAQQVVGEYGGVFPQHFEGLLKLPGIGPSTAAALMAFCYNQRVSILDGNVKRILTRVTAYSKDTSTSLSNKELWELAQSLLPSQNDLEAHPNEKPSLMASYTQGLMDLGATLCLPRQAHCAQCPLSQICEAHQTRTELNYPVKTKKLKRGARSSQLLVLQSPLGVWLYKRPAKGIWGGLYSLPLWDDEHECSDFIQTIKPMSVIERPYFKHVLTHLDWMLQPVLVQISQKQAMALPQTLLDLKGEWFEWGESLALGLPAPIKKLLESAARGVKLGEDCAS